MSRPCDHPDGPTFPDICKVCWKYDNVPAYRALWDAAPTTPKTVVTPTKTAAPKLKKTLPTRTPCKHLGAATGISKVSSACVKVQAELHECKIKGACTLRVLCPQLECCRICKDYEPSVIEASEQ